MKLMLITLIMILAVPNAFAGGLSDRKKNRIVSVDVDFPARTLVRTTFVVANGSNPLDQFKVKRVRKIGAPLKYKKPLIFLGTFSTKIEEYEITTNGNYRDTVLGNLAFNNIDVWAVEDRLNNNPAADCDNGTLDCTVMADWGLDQRIRDTAFVTRLIKRSYRLFARGVKPAIAGHTGGGITAIAAVNAAPGKFSGLFSSGSAISNDPAINARNSFFCSGLQERANNGEIIDTGLDAFTPIISLAQLDPTGLSPLQPGLTNLQFLIGLLSTPGGLGASSYTNDYILAQGDVFSGSLTYMDLGAFYEFFPLISRVASINGLSDVSCTAAGSVTRFTDNLASFSGNVSLAGTGAGLGPFLEEVSEMFMGAEQIELSLEPVDGGEFDNFLVEDDVRKSVFDQKIIDLVNSVL